MAKRFGMCDRCAHLNRPMHEGPLSCALCGNPAGDHFVPMPETPHPDTVRLEEAEARLLQADNRCMDEEARADGYKQRLEDAEGRITALEEALRDVIDGWDYWTVDLCKDDTEASIKAARALLIEPN